MKVKWLVVRWYCMNEFDNRIRVENETETFNNKEDALERYNELEIIPFDCTQVDLIKADDSGWQKVKMKDESGNY